VTDDPGMDLTQLLKNKLASKGTAAAARKQRDKQHKMKPTDGRRARRGAAAERPEQINFKCVLGTKERIQAAADALGVSMVGVLERGLELVEKEAGIGGAR
jgi:hypothetical protein